ncbi:unnamed protein product [Mesocestoides corti]|uniref:Ovule protein n=1 Tax=Mesocestoides corti TaxID=53468 RepID=A0A0R3U259_MESCO|nr:unnamed protein product [Mesocestoides corti]
MGNASSPAKKSVDDDVPLNHDNKKLSFLNIDPRSPTEGIVRTPIVLEKPSNLDIFQPLKNSLPFDTSEFESIDGCLTEDDSVHHIENESALSDGALPANGSGDKANRKGGPFARIRRSLVSHRFRVSQIRDSPSLFVKMRQRQLVEVQKQQCNHKEQMKPEAELGDAATSCTPAK